MKELTTLEEIKIYSDPYRLQILNTFFKLDRPATVKEIADEMGEVPAKVHYHVKKLERIGLLSMVATKEINGIVAKYYEAFSGMIQIKQPDLPDNPSSHDLIRSEAFKLLSELYEQNKERFFKQVRASEKPYASITNITLYMTDEESREFNNKIDKLCEPYKEKRDGEQIRTFEFFATNIREAAK